MASPDAVNPIIRNFLKQVNHIAPLKKGKDIEKVATTGLEHTYATSFNHNDGGLVGVNKNLKVGEYIYGGVQAGRKLDAHTIGFG